MDWYYAENNQQRGPVSDVELAGLVTSNIVNDQTLVWHAGMANWQPYGEVKAGAAPAPTPSVASPAPAVQPGQPEFACAECGRTVARDEAVQFGSAWVCAGCKPVFVQKMKEGIATPPAGTFRFAGFWLRVAAKLVDLLALGIVLGVPTSILMFTQIQKAGLQTSPDPFAFLGLQVLLQILSVVGIVFYNTFFIGKYGATLGKMAVGLKVIVADGTPPTYWRAFGRAWAEQLSGLTCYIGYIIAGFDNERRALHDHICNTRVVLK